MVVYDLPSGKRYCTNCKSTSCSHISHTPSFPMERDIKENMPISGFTSNSQAITSNSRGGHDLIRRKYNRKKSMTLYERFHNYGVKFEAKVDWVAIFVDPIKLRNNVEYKRLDFPDAIIKVFKRSILVTLRASRDIEGFDVKVAESKAIALLIGVLDRLPKSVIVSDDERVSVHNAFVNHPTAKLFKKVYGREMNVKDESGSSVLITDNSNGHELEYVKNDSAIPLSEHREAYEADLIFNKPDFPSVQDKKISYVVDVLKGFADQFVKHSEVQQKQADNQDRMAIMLDRLGDKISNSAVLSRSNVENLQDSNLNPLNSGFKDRTISRYDVERKDRIKRLKEEYGW